MASLAFSPYCRYRENGLLRLSLHGSSLEPLEAFSEVGLPPKKLNCYEADFTDCTTFVRAFLATLLHHLALDSRIRLTTNENEKDAPPCKDSGDVLKENSLQNDPFSRVPPFAFSSLRRFVHSNELYPIFITTLFCALDACPYQQAPFGRASSALVEAAIVYLHAEYEKVTVRTVIGVDNAPVKYRVVYRGDRRPTQDHSIVWEKSSVGFFRSAAGDATVDEFKDKEKDGSGGKPEFVIHSEVPEGIVIKPTPYGLGVFTDKDFKTGQVLYTGRWCEIEDAEENRPFVLRTNIGDFAMTTEVHSVAVLGNKRQVYGFDGFMNHSCDPTTYSADERRFEGGGTYDTVALKDIPAGSEVTCDYDLFEFDSRDKGITQCACGSKICRGQAIGFKHIPAATQAELLHRACPQVLEAYRDAHDREHEGEQKHDQESLSVVHGAASGIREPDNHRAFSCRALSKHATFYTAALNENIEKMVDSAEFGSAFTPHLKIKLDGDIHRASAILKSLHAADQKRGQKRGDTEECTEDELLWSVDANCGWAPDVALEMVAVLQPYAAKIFMVEQPFPVDFVRAFASPSTAPDLVSKWKEVKAAYNALGIAIFADESMRTAEDVSVLAPFVDGVNIKLEKVGGYRTALTAIVAAKDAGLAIWFGCMVGTNLNSNQTAQLLDFSIASDLDGGLLIDEQCQLFTGGFAWGNATGDHANRGRILLPPDNKCTGLGMTLHTRLDM